MRQKPEVAAVVLLSVSWFVVSGWLDRRAAEPQATHPALPQAARFPAMAVPAPGPSVTGGDRGCTVQADSSGLWLRAADFTFTVRACALSQGGSTAGCADAPCTEPTPGTRVVDRGPVIEECTPGEGRVRHVLRIPSALGDGPLCVRLHVRSDLGGTVEEIPWGAGGWNDPQVFESGLWFCDLRGSRRIAYHGSVARDSAGHGVPVQPRFENGDICLEIPATFVSKAVFPLTLEPTFEARGP